MGCGCAYLPPLVLVLSAGLSLSLLATEERLALRGATTLRPSAGAFMAHQVTAVPLRWSSCWRGPPPGWAGGWGVCVYPALSVLFRCARESLCMRLGRGEGRDFIVHRSSSELRTQKAQGAAWRLPPPLNKARGFKGLLMSPCFQLSPPPVCVCAHGALGGRWRLVAGGWRLAGAGARRCVWCVVFSPVPSSQFVPQDFCSSEVF